MSNATDPDPDPLGDAKETAGTVGRKVGAGLMWVLSGVNAFGMWFGTNFWKAAGFGARKVAGSVKWVINGGVGRELLRAVVYTAIGILVLSSMGVIQIT